MFFFYVISLLQVEKILCTLLAMFVPASLRTNNYSFYTVSRSIGINLHEWVFQKAEIAWAASASPISSFWKTHKCKLISNWTRKTVWLLINNTNMKKFARKKCQKMFLEATFFAFENTFFRISVKNFHHCFTWDHWPRKFLIVFLQIIIQNYDV